MHDDLHAHATLLRHAIARFVELRIDGLVRSAASGSRALTWALRHLVEEIRTGPPSGDHAPPAAAWPDEEDETDTQDMRATRERPPALTTQRRIHRHPRRIAMIAQDYYERAGQILRHGRTTHGRLPTWQRQRPQVHGARTGPRSTGVIVGQGVRHGRRGRR